MSSFEHVGIYERIEIIFSFGAFCSSRRDDINKGVKVDLGITLSADPAATLVK